MYKKYLIITIILLTGYLLIAGFLPAATAANFQQGLNAVGGTSGLTTQSFSVYATNIVKALLGLTGMIFFALLIYGGVLYMISAGEADKVKKGKNALKSAIIGMVIIIAGYTITFFISQTIEQKTGQGVVPGFNEKCEDSTDMNYYSLDCCEYRYQVYTSTSAQCCSQSSFFSNHADACGGTQQTYARCGECSFPCDFDKCIKLSTPGHNCALKNMPWPEPDKCNEYNP